MDERLKSETESKLKSAESQSQVPSESEEQNRRRHERAQSQVWDCGSSLYDSFELQSFKRELDSAIITSSRTLSMPHLSDRRRAPLPLPPPPHPQSSASAKISSKISRSLQKFLRSVFRSSKPSSSSLARYQSQDGFYVVYDKTGALTTIPEAPEIDHGGLSPEVNLLARRAASARFTASPIGISCA